MSPAELLYELEPLTHDARIRRMVELGRMAAHDPAVVATLGALGRGGTFERMLRALHACHGTRDGALAARTTSSDPYALIRRRRRAGPARALLGPPLRAAGAVAALVPPRPACAGGPGPVRRGRGQAILRRRTDRWQNRTVLRMARSP